VKDRLLKASNQQLLRLQRVVTTVKEKWGSRDKLIAAIGAAMNKTKDQDYLAKLATFSLPRLLDLGISAERASRASR
jgi:fructose-1-phosphate kinase PfkB-like protein